MKYFNLLVLAFLSNTLIISKIYAKEVKDNVYLENIINPIELLLESPHLKDCETGNELNSVLSGSCSKFLSQTSDLLETVLNNLSVYKSRIKKCGNLLYNDHQIKYNNTSILTIETIITNYRVNIIETNQIGLNYFFRRKSALLLKESLRNNLIPNLRDVISIVEEPRDCPHINNSRKDIKVPELQLIPIDNTRVITTFPEVINQ